MSMLWWVGYAVMAWGAFDICRRFWRAWMGVTSGGSIYTGPNIPRF